MKTSETTYRSDPSVNYLNEFSCEWWRGDRERELAADYVTRVSFAFTNGQVLLVGRIGGAATDDQARLARVRDEITATVFNALKGGAQ